MTDIKRRDVIVERADNSSHDESNTEVIQPERLQAKTADLCLMCGIIRTSPDHQCAPGEDGEIPEQLSTANWIGIVVGNHYQILSLIGRGGMSTVFKARHQLLKKMVALKILTPQFRVDHQNLLRFQQEAVSVGRLDHVNIIKIYEFAVPDDREPFLVMDYVEGKTLADEIAKKPLSLKRTLNIGEQICAGLSHAHKMGVIHRDLKPSNVMLVNDANETVKIVDFGIAKILTPDIAAAKLTQTGEIFGSPLYMSPEQCLGKALDARSDIYSLGCLLFESLTGHVPFEGASVLETIQLHLYGVPPLTTASGPPIEHSDAMNAIIVRCLAKNPDERFQSMEEVQKALKHLTGSQKESISERFFLSWQLHNLVRDKSKSSNFTAQIGTSVIALAIALTAFVIWQKSSLTGFDGGSKRRRTVDSSIQATDAELQKQFNATMILGQNQFDDGRFAQARETFLDFKKVPMSTEEATLLKPQVLAMLSDLEFADNKTELSLSYQLEARALRDAAVQPPYQSAVAELKKLALDNKSEPSPGSTKPAQTHIHRIDEDVFDNLNDEAKICEELQAFKKAEEILRRTLRAVTDYLPAGSAQIARTEKNLAHVCFIVGNYKEAHGHYEKALQIRRLKPGYYDLDLIITLKDAAELDIAMNNFDEAHRYLDQAIQLMKNNANIDNWIMADLHVLRAKVFMHLGAQENVESELREAQSIYSMIPVQNDVYQEKADFLVQWSEQILKTNPSDKKALVALQDAVKLYEQAPLKSNVEFASALKLLASGYTNDYALATAVREARTSGLNKRAEAIINRSGRTSINSSINNAEKIDSQAQAN